MNDRTKSQSDRIDPHSAAQCGGRRANAPLPARPRRAAQPRVREPPSAWPRPAVAARRAESGSIAPAARSSALPPAGGGRLSARARPPAVAWRSAPEDRPQGAVAAARWLRVTESSHQARVSTGALPKTREGKRALARQGQGAAAVGGGRTFALELDARGVLLNRLRVQQHLVAARTRRRTRQSDDQRPRREERSRWRASERGETGPHVVPHVLRLLQRQRKPLRLVDGVLVVGDDVKSLPARPPRRVSEHGRDQQARGRAGGRGLHADGGRGSRWRPRAWGVQTHGTGSASPAADLSLVLTSSSR
jgi:hypothetical protein